jgi:hypothetical protein
VPAPIATPHAAVRRHGLGDPNGDKLESPRLAGRFAAFVDQSHPPFDANGATAQVDLFDLATGHRRRTLDSEAPGSDKPIGSGYYYRVAALALDRHADLAWISRSARGDGSAVTLGVHALDRRGARLLDQGGDIDPRSLRLARRSVSWRRGGASRSSRLR